MRLTFGETPSSHILASETRSVNLRDLERLAEALGINHAILVAHECAPEPQKAVRAR